MASSQCRYTYRQKRLILAQLVLNNGDVPLTSQETGVPRRTLYRWRATLDGPLAPVPLSEGSPSREPVSSAPSRSVPLSEGSPSREPVPPGLLIDDTILAQTRQEFLDKMRLIFHSMDEAIPHASLAERVIAATRIFDRLVKLSTVDPFAPHPSQIVSYHIIGSETFEPDDDPDDSYHNDEEYRPETPAPASEDQPPAVESGRAWMTDFTG